MCKKEPKCSDSESKGQRCDTDVEDFVLEELARNTSNLRVGDSRNSNARSELIEPTPFGCPMGMDWEVWLACRIKPRKETMTRVGKQNKLISFSTPRKPQLTSHLGDDSIQSGFIAFLWVLIKPNSGEDLQH